MNQAVAHTLSLGSVQTNKTPSVIDRHILSLDAAASDLGCQGSGMSMWGWELEGIGLFRGCREGLGWVECV